MYEYTCQIYFAIYDRVDANIIIKPGGWSGLTPWLISWIWPLPRCIKMSPIESLLQYRFATSNPLKARPGLAGCRIALLRNSSR